MEDVDANILIRVQNVLILLVVSFWEIFFGISHLSFFKSMVYRLVQDMIQKVQFGVSDVYAMMIGLEIFAIFQLLIRF